MRKRRENSGFTMAELLIVVAIIVILSGVGFIAVQNHQRSLAQLERNNIAKEIFFAAQNHLTLAESQGYLGVSSKADDADATISQYGKLLDGTTGVYLIGNSMSGVSQMLDLMLPFGSIDELVRSGGSYLIRYQANPANVLDVYYCSTSGTPDKFNHTLTVSDYESAGESLKNGIPGSSAVVGWYGGGETAGVGTYLEPPTVKIDNAERLTVTVTQPFENAGATIELIISGEADASGKAAKAVILLNPAAGITKSDRVSDSKTVTDPVTGKQNIEYTVTLDDITTADMHFVDLNSYSGNEAGASPIWFMDPTLAFRPGEDVTVEAVTFGTTTRTNIAYSNAETANSLFADTIDSASATADHTNVLIGNFRHFENLSADISGYAPTAFETPSDGAKLRVTATQINDLIWTGDSTEAFSRKIEKTTVKVFNSGDNTGTKDNCCAPVSVDGLNFSMVYNGNGHAISNAVVDVTAADAKAVAGLFGALTDCEVKNLKLTNTSVALSVSGSVTGVTASAGALAGALTNCRISNVELLDSGVTSTGGNAGALAGALSGGAVSNVLARNSDNATDVNITASGSAGGLIGAMGGDAAKVEKSAAALIVKSTGGDAGGLIGTIDGAGTTVAACYSGGHTVHAEDGRVLFDSSAYNVTASDNAGGLIGDAGSARVSYCYSTCSASGATAGGFVGEANGIVADCYAAGLVSGTTAEGAFAGYLGKAPSEGRECSYYMIVNERTTDKTKGYTYLPATGNGLENRLTPLDDTATTYNAFIGGSDAWKDAVPYDSLLTTYYGAGSATGTTQYILPTVARLGATVSSTDFVATHYGDWPAPEVFVVNTK